MEQLKDYQHSDAYLNFLKRKKLKGICNGEYMYPEECLDKFGGDREHGNMGRGGGGLRGHELLCTGYIRVILFS